MNVKPDSINARFIELTKKITNKGYNYMYQFVKTVNSKTNSPKFTIFFNLKSPSQAEYASYATMGGYKSMVKSESLGAGKEKAFFEIIINLNPLSFQNAFIWMLGPEFEEKKKDIHMINTNSGTGFLSIMWVFIHEMTHGINLHVDWEGKVYRAYQEYYANLLSSYKSGTINSQDAFRAEARSSFPEAFVRGISFQSKIDDVAEGVRRLMQMFNKFNSNRWYGPDEDRNSSHIVRSLWEQEVTINAALFILPVFIIYMEVLFNLKLRMHPEMEDYKQLIKFLYSYNGSNILDPEQNVKLYEIIRRLVKSCLLSYTRIQYIARNMLSYNNAYQIIGDLSRNHGSSYVLLEVLLKTIQNANEKDDNNIVGLVIDFVSNEIAYGIYQIVKNKNHSELLDAFKNYNPGGSIDNINPLFVKIGSHGKSVMDYVRESILYDYKCFIEYHDNWSGSLNLELELYKKSVDFIKSTFNIINYVIMKLGSGKKLEDEQLHKELKNEIERINKDLPHLMRLNSAVAAWSATVDRGHDIDFLKVVGIKNPRLLDFIVLQKDKLDRSGTIERIKNILINLFSALLPEYAQEIAAIAAEEYVTMILSTETGDNLTLNSEVHNKQTSIRVAILRAINKKQNASNNYDVWHMLSTTRQMSKLWSRLKAENVIFTIVGNGNDAFHSKGKEGIDPNSLPTGASEQILSLIEKYDKDTNEILKRMYNYVKKVMDILLFTTKESSNNKSPLEIYFNSELTDNCGFQYMYDKLFEHMFRVKNSDVTTYTADNMYYRGLFYTNFTDSIAIGTLLPSVLRTIPVFMDNILSYDENNCEPEYIETSKEKAKNYVKEFISKISERNREGIEENAENKIDSNTFSNTGLATRMSDAWEPDLTLRTKQTESGGYFDTKRPRDMKSREFVLEFAVVIGSRRPVSCPTDDDETRGSGPGGDPGGGSGPGGDPGGGSGQGGDPRRGQGGDPGGGSGPGGDPRRGQGGDPRRGQGGDPGGGSGQGGGELSEKVEKLIERIGDLVPNIQGTGIDETTGVIKELIKELLKEIGETEDIDSEANTIRGILISQIIKSAAEAESDKSIVERKAEEANIVKEKLREIIQGKLKNREDKETKEGGDDIERDRDWTGEDDDYDPSLFQDDLMRKFDEVMVEYLEEGGRTGGRERLLVQAAFELAGLSSGVLDLVYRLLAQHVHDSVFKNRSFSADSVYRATPEEEVMVIDTIYKRPALIAPLTKVTKVIPTSTQIYKRTYKNTPTIVSDYLSIDVSGSLHGVIMKALKAHESIQTNDGDEVKISQNPVFSSVTEYIVKYLASKIYSYLNKSNASHEMDNEMKKAMQSLVNFMNEFKKTKLKYRGSLDFYDMAAEKLKDMADSFDKIFNLLVKDMRSLVVNSSDKSNVTIATLLNHISSVLYMGIYANPISFLSAKREGGTLSKNIVSVIHDGEVPATDNYGYPFTITSTDNYSGGAPFFPSLTKSVDIQKGPSLMQLIKHIRRHSRNLHGGNDPAPLVGAFWARTLLKDIILSAVEYYRRGVESNSLKIAFNVLHLTDCVYPPYYNSLEGHVAGFVNYLMSEEYKSGSYPAYKQIIDGLIEGHSVHDVVSSNIEGIDPNIKQALQQIRDNIEISTMIFEKNGVGLLVNIFDSNKNKGAVSTYVYYIDFVDLVVYQFEESYSSEDSRKMFSADTRNVLSKIKFSKMFDKIIEEYGVPKGGSSSSKREHLDDSTKKLMFIQSVASIMPRSVKYYTMNTAVIAIIYMFYSILVLALISSNLSSLGNLGEQKEEDKNRITMDTKELMVLKSKIAKISAELDNHFMNNIIIRGIFWNLINRYITPREVNMQWGKLLGFEQINAYTNMKVLRAAAYTWLKRNSNVSIEDIISYLEGGGSSSETAPKGQYRGLGLYGYTDADANDNPMGGIIPLIPTT